ncbi:BCCT family transporter, partial [Aeromonas enteropelogenes]
MRASKGLLKGLNPTMAMTALTVITLFLLFGVFVPDTAAAWFTGAKDQIIAGFKWYYILVVALFLFFAVYLMFSRFGNIRLGDDDQVPEFGYFAWFSMLFSAGMGIGLVFWSIAEPMYHLQDNPFITEGMTPEAAQVAMRLTFFHWGLHPWAIYVIVGLSLAFFSYRRKLPLAIRSVLYPILGDR